MTLDRTASEPFPALSVGDLTALVLVGGEGSRLRSVIGEKVPKPLAMVCGQPFVWYLLHYLAAEGVSRVLLAASHLVVEFRRRLSELTPPGVEVIISEEPHPLGTAGAIAWARAQLRNDPALVLNGDSICLTPLASFLAFHVKKHAFAAVMLMRAANTARYGAVHIDETGRIMRFVEKDREAGPGLINAGVYLLSQRALATIPEMQPCSLERNVLPLWAGHGLYGFVSGGPFIDIGTPESFREAQTFLANWALGKLKPTIPPEEFS